MTFTIYQRIVNNLGIRKTKKNNNNHYFERRPTDSLGPRNKYMHIKFDYVKWRNRLVHMTQLDVRVSIADQDLLYYGVI
jgi:hypothetical protein